MKHRIIIVPKDKNAAEDLNYNNAAPDQLLKVTLNEDEFNELWRSGFFERINSITGANIDNYEDECIIVNEELQKVIASGIFTENGIDKMEQIKLLFEEAVKRGTGIYFYF